MAWTLLIVPNIDELAHFRSVVIQDIHLRSGFAPRPQARPPIPKLAADIFRLYQGHTDQTGPKYRQKLKANYVLAQTQSLFRHVTITPLARQPSKLALLTERPAPTEDKTMSTPIEHNEPVKATKIDDTATNAGAKLGAEFANNMNAPKAESSAPASADKHLTNLQLTDANGNIVSSRQGERTNAASATNGDKSTPVAATGHGEKPMVTGTGSNPAPSPEAHRNDDHGIRTALGVAGAVALGTAAIEGATMIGPAPVIAGGLAAFAGYEAYQALQGHR